MHDYELSYILNELAENRDEYFGAISPPIIQTSNFAIKTVAVLRASFKNEYSTWLYSRGLNPTVDILRKKLAALDGAEDCLVFNSGAAAIFAAVMANVKSGDHIVSVKNPYTWVKKLFNDILPRFNVQTTYVDGTQTKIFKDATNANTVIYYLETPNSWTYDLQDLKAVAALAKENNILTICDNSYCTPLYQKPIALGIDMALQSATKYIGGHSDVIAGVLCGTTEMMERIFNSEYLCAGSGIQPFNAWLLIRGLRTLPVRMKQISETTQAIVEFLDAHESVEKVIFPFKKDFPQYELAKQQMTGACGLLTFVLKANTINEVELFCNSLKHILMAVSWGGHESLIIPGCAVIDAEAFDSTIPEHRMLRLYAGLEDSSYIINDLRQAFDIVQDSGS